MTKDVRVVTVAALAAAAFFFGALGYEVIHVGNNVAAATAQVKHDEVQLAAQLSSELDKVDYTRKTVDDLLVKTTTLIIDADDTESKEADFLAAEQQRLDTTLGHVDDSIQAFTVNQNDLTAHVGGTLDQLRITLAAVPPVSDNLNLSLKQIQTTLADPSIHETAKNVQSMTASGASILKDGADETHKLVHPDKKKLGFWGVTNAVVEYARKFIPPLF
jgi:hypothetical protein